jgi:Bacteriophage tail sheath protein
VLRLGLANGGREVSSHAALRPAPNAAVFDETDLDTLGELRHNQVASLTLDGEVVVIPVSANPTRPFFVPQGGGFATGRRGGLDGIVERLRVVRDAVNAHAAATPSFGWTAELWGPRLALRRTAGGDNDLLPADLATAPTDLAGSFSDNTKFATLGASGLSLGNQTSPAVAASDGAAPLASDYDDAYEVVEQEVDLFNLLVLPKANTGALDRKTLWGPASIFCRNNRAFLLVDPPPTWTDHVKPLSGTGANDSITDLRTGLVKDHAAVHYPDLVIDEDGRRVLTAASGAVAGLMARTDDARGVWKAAAGTEADLRGIVGVQRAFSNAQNGILNPRAVNTVRRFPTGIVNWGARTMDGDDDTGSEYKYVPIRRLLLFLEESIYRGLQWTVFEPNGLDLWAAIRLNVGSFLDGLYRRGAFAGATASQAYYVKCDAETTTPTDRALGIVNVQVGVATLKPAEFVVISFRQITLPEE